MSKNTAQIVKRLDKGNEIQGRLRELIAFLEQVNDISEEAERIVMDADLDGQRYLLVAMPRIDRKPAPLSPREVEIVRLVSHGHPNKVIAAVLEISSWTVCTHLRRIFAKLDVNSRAAMVARISEFSLPFEPLAAPAWKRQIETGKQEREMLPREPNKVTPISSAPNSKRSLKISAAIMQRIEPHKPQLAPRYTAKIKPRRPAASLLSMRDLLPNG